MKPIRSFLSALIGGLSIFLTLPSKAEYYQFTGAGNESIDGSDILYSELRYPYWHRGMYNARWLPSVAGPATSGGYYSGPGWANYTGSSTGTRSVGFIHTAWAIDYPVTPGDSITPEWWSLNLKDVPSIGEGASGKVEGSWPMSTGVWYPAVLRVWSPTGNPANVSKLGQWFKDGATGRWHHVVTFHQPYTANRFTGDGGFQELLGAKTARVEYRKYYFRKSGSWKAGKNFTAGSGHDYERATVGMMESNSAAFFENSDDPAYQGNLGPYQSMTVSLTMPDTPTFDPIVLSGVTAKAAANQVAVKWSLSNTSAPQFAYKIEVFPTSNTSGTPAVTVSKIDPDASEVLVPTSGLATPSVKVTLTSIFDQLSSPATATASSATLSNASSPAGTVGGLGYKYYEGSWTSLPAFNASLDSSSMVQSGGTAGADNSFRRRANRYACQYKGYLNVPADGLWAFSLRSSDGSRLIIDGATVIDFDGIHSAGSEMTATAGLRAGRHAVEIQYFKSDPSSPSPNQSGEEDFLRVLWEGPSVAKGTIPESAWSRVPAAGEPLITLTAPASGAQIPGNSGLTATVTANGQALNSVRFYNKGTCVGATSTSSASGSNQLFTSSELLGTGASQLRARLIYGPNGQYTLDSPVISATVTPPAISPWQFSAIGPHAFQGGSSVSGGTHSLVGDNLNFNWQLISGDATIVSRIARRPSQSWVSQFDGSDYDSYWSAGIIFRQDLNPVPGSEIGSRFITLLSSVANTLHLQDNTNVNGGGQFWPENLQNASGTYSWLKLQRVGNVFNAFLSTDGVTWTAAGSRDLSSQGFSQSMYVGVYTLARPSNNTNPHRWQFDNVAITGTAGSIPATAMAPKPPEQYWALRENTGTTAYNDQSTLHAAYQGNTLAWNGQNTRPYFDGVNDRVVIPPLNVNLRDLTISGVVWRNGDQIDWSGLVYNSAQACGLFLGPDNDLRFAWSNQHWGASSGLVVPNGTYTFVAVSISSAGATFYMQPLQGDGRSMQKATVPAALPFANLTGQWYIGYDANGPGRYFKGTIEDVGIYYRALNADEIQYAYEEAVRDLTVAWQSWPMRENTGTTAYNERTTLHAAYQGNTLAWNGQNTRPYFDGVNDRVVIPPLNLSTQDFSVSGILWRNGDQIDWSGLIYDSAQGCGLFLGPDNDLRFAWNNQHWGISSGLVVPNGTFTFVGLTVTGNRATFYMQTLQDGSEMRTTVLNTTQTTANLTGQWFIGYDANGPGRYFKGTIEDVRMYSYALSPSQMRAVQSYSMREFVTSPNHRWKLDEDSGTVADSATSGLDGTYEGGVTLAAAGAGTYASFDGVDDRVRIPAMNLTTRNFAITGWVWRNGNQADWAGIFTSRGSGEGLFFGPGNELRYMWGGQNWNFGSGLTVPGGWCFVAVSIEPAKATLYLHDGYRLSKMTHSIPQYIAGLNSEWLIGSDAGGTNRYFKGWLKDFRVHYGTLSEAQVRGVMATTGYGTLPQVAVTSPANGANLPSPVSTTIDAAISLGGGYQIRKVQFYDNGTLVGEDTTAPWSVNWSSSSTGTHSIRARAVYGLQWEDAVWSPVTTVTVSSQQMAAVAGAGSGADAESQEPASSGDPASPLPPWQRADIGAPAIAGASSHAAGRWTLSGSGSGIGNQADEFHYTWQSLSGDGSITARLVSQDRHDGWGKAGVMIRESLVPDSRHALMAITPDHGFIHQYRSATHGTTTVGGTWAGTPPGWLRLTRTGNVIRAYSSADGVTWTQRGGDLTLAMAANIHIGLAVSSNDNGQASTAVFDNVTVVP